MMTDALSVQRRVVENPSRGQSTSRVIVSHIWAPSPSSAMQKVRTCTRNKIQEQEIYSRREVVCFAFIQLNTLQLNYFNL